MGIRYWDLRAPTKGKGEYLKFGMRCGETMLPRAGESVACGLAIDLADPIYALRQQLAREITSSLGGARSQFIIAPYYGIPQPRMSELARGIVDRSSAG